MLFAPPLSRWHAFSNIIMSRQKYLTNKIVQNVCNFTYLKNANSSWVVYLNMSEKHQDQKWRHRPAKVFVIFKRELWMTFSIFDAICDVALLAFSKPTLRSSFSIIITITSDPAYLAIATMNCALKSCKLGCVMSL